LWPRRWGWTPRELLTDPRLDALVPLIQERIKLLTEAAPLVDWAFATADAITYPDPAQLIGKKLTAGAERGRAARRAGAAGQRSSRFELHALEEDFRARAEAMGRFKVGSFFAPFRVAITGRTVAPPLFESMVVLGRAETMTPRGEAELLILDQTVGVRIPVPQPNHQQKQR
jgi:glutamyl-tRNA synthetase